MRTLIKDGTVVTATDTYAADVWIEDGVITAIAAPGQRAALGVADVVVDARGKYVMPGGIDCHTHMDLPFGGTNSSDDFDTGTYAAAHGGTTTIIDFAIQQKGGAMRAGLDTWHAKAEGRAAIDYGFHMIMTEANPQALAEMADMVREGVTSFKMFMAYPGVFLVDDQQIFRAMLRAGELGALITMHAEIGLPIDVLVQRALSEGHTAPVYMVHLSAQRALERVMEARDRGLPAYAETCPQYLFCSEDDLRGSPGPDGEWKGAGYVCTPPLRPAHHHDHLWRGLRNYDLQVVATDHCPFCMKDQKELGRGNFSKIPNGMPGVETRLHLLWEGVRAGRISMNRFVEITATAPAKIFGLYPKKGTIAIGGDADIVVWDPAREQVLGLDTLHMNVDYSPFEGRRVIGSPAQVLSRGEVIVEDNRWVGKQRQGRGKFLKRATFGL
ncbi:MAG: dihydropyrimidinase [Deltaproteobacteria bacterium]|nr:dihydropyrimidinase [Deltaproteobacteria bacterium]